MKKFRWTLGVVLFAGFFYAFVMWAYVMVTPYKDPLTNTFSYEWSKFLWWPSWLVVAAVALAVPISIWGFIGVAIAKARAKIETLAEERAIISEKSWHYRLQNWLGNDPANIRGECEYWPKLIHGLIFLLPGITLLRAVVIPAAYCVFTVVIVPIVLFIAWLVGARTKFFLNMDVEQPYFHKGYQLLGPMVAMCMLIIGIITSIQFTDWGQIAWSTVSNPSWSWQREGLYAAWALTGIAVLCAVVTIAVVAIKIIKSLRPVVSYWSARIVGKCRRIEYTK